MQKWIGYADVKSHPTYFYVQKTGSFPTLGLPIPFELERLNIGKAIDVKTGVFTARRKGVYFFAFKGLSKITATSGLGVSTTTATSGYVDVALMMNGVQVGKASSNCGSEDCKNQRETLSLQSTIELKQGDRVWLQIEATHGAYLQDDDYTHFYGWMLQEALSP